jgi:hypothetical protein
MSAGTEGDALAILKRTADVDALFTAIDLKYELPAGINLTVDQTALPLKCFTHQLAEPFRTE